MLTEMIWLQTISDITLIPAWFWLAAVFVFGAIIGSFLNVYVYRLHTGKSLGGHSHCLSCAKPLRWFELFPLFSYLGLRGRCRVCHSRIPVRYFVVELVTAGLFVIAASVADSLVMLGWLAMVLAILICITVYDYYHFIVPDELTAALVLLTTGWLGWQWWTGDMMGAALLTIVGASLAGAGFYFFLWFVSGGQWLGFGDVKLAVPLGIWVGPTEVFSSVVLSFWIGACISLLVVGWQRYQRGQQRLHLSAETLTMKSAVPFAPFMIAAAVLVYFTQINVLSFFSFS